MTAADPVRAYEAAARDMHNTERRIASMTQWETPSPDSINGRILASLIIKRDRDAPHLAALKAEADRVAPA
ncbi:hypothetical protein, partial [Rhodopseudomonas sp. B29]|uniref:hypothetical protein n=1 Tax=Rhodopseudomonas sp. B29 TaxID=95607 RepID=UPI0004CE9BF3